MIHKRGVRFRDSLFVRALAAIVPLSVPLLLALLGPYLQHHLPGYETHPLWWHVGGDLVFFSSLFVIGGEFWDKLRALFVHGARAVFPSTSGGKGGNDE